MKPIRIFRHLVCQNPGFLGDYLQQQGIPWEMVCVDEAHPVELKVDDASALVFMGAGVSVNDRLPWMGGELDLMHRALDCDVPILGVCFGAQMLSQALNGSVYRGEEMEIGWHPVSLCRQHDETGWLTGLPDEFMVFQWHADTFSLPAGCRPLIESDCYPHQAFALGDHLGLQFHLEMTEAMVKSWIERYGSDLQNPSGCRQSGEQILTNLEQRIDQLHRISVQMYGNWLERVLERVSS
ncbi:MAG: type 1 glutamine amidotransferase [Candidatus Thiodiazotropha sp.]